MTKPDNKNFYLRILVEKKGSKRVAFPKKVFFLRKSKNLGSNYPKSNIDGQNKT
jgi:hypothetical protein